MNSIYNQSSKNNIMKLKSSILVFLTIIFIIPNISLSQSVSHALSGITSTVSKFKYSYIMSPTQKKDIEYIIVLSSTNEVKTVFNACDVCYQSHKGYAQSGTILVCNNCGNKFQISALGSKNTGGTCSPGYLPHTIENGNVVINVSDLIVGEYFFLIQNTSNIDNSSNVPFFQLCQDNSNLILKLNNSNDRNFKIINMNGQICKNTNNSSNEVLIKTTDLTIGAYIIMVEEAGKTSTQSFYIYE